MNNKTIDPTEIFFHDILEQLKTNIRTNVKSITFMFMSSLRDKFMLLLQNTAADVSVFFSGCHAGTHPDGHQHGVHTNLY